MVNMWNDDMYLSAAVSLSGRFPKDERSPDFLTEYLDGFNDVPPEGRPNRRRFRKIFKEIDGIFDNV
jgi:hypothetical protein